MADLDPSTPPVITVTGVSLTHKRLARRSRIDAVATPDEQTVPTGEHVAGRTSSTTPDGNGAWRLELVRAPGLVYAIEDGSEVRLLVCDQTPGDHVAWSDLPIGVPPEQVPTDPILGIGSVASDGEGGMKITLTDGRTFTVPLERGPKGGVFDPADKGVRHETFHYQLRVETSEVFTPKMDRRVLYWDLVGHRENVGPRTQALREYLMTPTSVEDNGVTPLPLTPTLPGESDPQVDSEGNVVWLPEYTLVITGGATVIQWPKNVYQIGEPFFDTTATLARRPDGGWRLTWQPSHKPVVSLYNPIFTRFWNERSRDLSSLSMEEAVSVLDEYNNTLAGVVGYDVRSFISYLEMFAVENHQVLTPVTLSSFFGHHDGYLRIVSVKMPGGDEKRTLIADYLNVPTRELTEATRNMGLRSNTEGDMLYWEGTSWVPYSPYADDVTRLPKWRVGSAGASRYDTSRDKPFWVRGFDANGHPEWVDANGRTPAEHDESPNSGSMLVLNSPADYERNGRVKSVGVGVFFTSHGRPLWLIQENGVWFWIDAVGTKIMEAPAPPPSTSPT